MRVLILAYDFPPFVSVGGLRPWSWYRYLGEFGVEPTVVTRQWENRYGDERDYIAPGATQDVEVERTALGTIVRTTYTPNLSNRLLLAHGPDRLSFFRRLVTAGFEVAQYYAVTGTKAQLYHGARAWLREHPVDAIVATGEPFVLFRFASLLSAEFGVPWVADFRDPWSQDKRRAGLRISRRWEEGVERRATASAAALTTVADSVRDVLSGLHAGRRIEVVPNGYDPEAMAAADGVEQVGAPLTLAFTGSLYGWHPVESVFRVLDDFARTAPGPGLALRMIGVGGRESLEGLLRDRFPALAPRVTFTPRLANDEMARELASAHAFLMFNNYAYPGTKIFDYLALRRRVLLCYADDPEARELKARHYNLDLAPGADERALERMVTETRSGVVVRDAAHLRRVLEDFSAELREKGALDCPSVGVEAYSRRTQAGRLAALLKELAG